MEFSRMRREETGGKPTPRQDSLLRVQVIRKERRQGGAGASLGTAKDGFREREKEGKCDEATKEYACADLRGGIEKGRSGRDARVEFRDPIPPLKRPPCRLPPLSSQQRCGCSRCRWIGAIGGRVREEPLPRSATIKIYAGQKRGRGKKGGQCSGRAGKAGTAPGDKTASRIAGWQNRPRSHLSRPADPLITCICE